MDLTFEDIKCVAELPYNWDVLNNKTILISGGTGFIGSLFVDVIKYRNQCNNSNVKIVSLSRHGGTDDDSVKYIKQDIVNPIQYDAPVDYIIHLASNTHPKQYGEDPVGTITTNIIGCDNLLKLAALKQSKFILASSVEIYGQGPNYPMDETYCGVIDCNNARSGYNEAKRTCESLCQSYKQQYGVNVVIARFARVFGADKKKDTKALSQFLERAVCNEDIILKSKGQQRYSFCYIVDAVSGLFKLLIDGKNGEAYNISDEDEGLTLGEYAEYISNLAKKAVIFEIEDNPAASRASFALLDISKIKSIGWSPLYSVREGLKRTYLIKKKYG